MRIDQNRDFGLTEHVDEAGRNCQAARINDASRRSGRKRANSRNAPANNANIARIPWRTSPIDDVPVTNNGVELLGRRDEQKHESQKRQEPRGQMELYVGGFTGLTNLRT